jgi:hypothetical protein
MSEHYFDSWSSSSAARNYSPGTANQLHLQAGMVQPHLGPQLNPNCPNHYSSMYGMNSSTHISAMSNENVGITHAGQSQMHSSQAGTSVPQRRVVNIGVPTSVAGYPAQHYHSIEHQIHSGALNSNQEYFPNGTNDQPNRLYPVATPRSQAQEMLERPGPGNQEPSFQSLLSRQISEQGFSIRSFLDERNSTELGRAFTQGSNPSVHHMNSQLCAEETEEALFAV